MTIFFWLNRQNIYIYLLFKKFAQHKNYFESFSLFINTLILQISTKHFLTIFLFIILSGFFKSFSFPYQKPSTILTYFSLFFFFLLSNMLKLSKIRSLRSQSLVHLCDRIPVIPTLLKFFSWRLPLTSFQSSPVAKTNHHYHVVWSCCIWLCWLDSWKSSHTLAFTPFLPLVASLLSPSLFFFKIYLFLIN